MIKNIIKEIIIILLLVLAIILILGVMLYEYVPSNKFIPEKISYTTPESVKNELQTDTNVDDTEVVITYEIDSTDLNNYKKIQEYIPGKKNPFSSIVETNNNTTDDGNNKNNADNNTSSNANTTSINSTNSENTGYLPNKGTK